MPKLKTHKGAQKRFSLSGSGKIMRPKGGGSHLRRHKSARVKRQYGEMYALHKSDDRRIRELISYGAP